MQNHSIKVPRLYKVAAQVAKEVSEGIGSIKSLVYEKQKKHPNIKAIYALVSTLFQKSEEIETLLKRSLLLVKETRFDPWLAKILLVELLWGKKYLPGQSKPENTVRAYEQIFKAHLSDTDTSTKESDYKENNKPRYVRVNTLISNLNEAVEGFQDEGWTLNKFLDKTDYKGYLEKISSLNNDEFMVDIHVPNLLVFPPGTEFYRHPAYKNGSIILQDKASCLPVHVMGPPPGSTVLDMCAAPGMKTTHMAAVLNDEGTVYATERNPKRFEILNNIISTSGAKCIKTFNKDVLDCTKDDFPGVEYILVDPSCSGTGMTNRPQENEINSSRLSSLTGFQIKILRHALTRFPDAKKVVYSTCSILPEENEDVVRQVLETNYNFKLIPSSQFVGETWQNFGSSDYGDIGKYCLYAKPNEDYTNGFFVAVFERLKEGEENTFFNTRIFNFKKHIQANEKWKHKKQQKYGERISNEEFSENVDNTNENSNNLGRNNRVETYTNKYGIVKNEDNVSYLMDENNEIISESKIKKKKKSVEEPSYENKIEGDGKHEEQLRIDKIQNKDSKKKKKKRNVDETEQLQKNDKLQEKSIKRKRNQPDILTENDTTVEQHFKKNESWKHLGETKWSEIPYDLHTEGMKKKRKIEDNVTMLKGSKIKIKKKGNVEIDELEKSVDLQEDKLNEKRKNKGISIDFNTAEKSSKKTKKRKHVKELIDNEFEEEETHTGDNKEHIVSDLTTEETSIKKKQKNNIQEIQIEGLKKKKKKNKDKK